MLDDFGFGILKMKEIISYIYSDNVRALRFSSQFGGFFDEKPIIRNGREMIKKTNTLSSYQEARKRLVKVLYR